MVLLVLFYLTSIIFYGTLALPKGSSALDNFPIIDGHNDLAHNLYTLRKNVLEGFNFSGNLTDDPIFGHNACNCCHTDLPRLKAGKVGAQFWAAYVPCSTQFKDAVPRTLGQIDVIKRLVQHYPDDLQFASTADEILKAIENKKIASLIGVEGGHSIDYKLSLLRIYYDLGVRYLTLTHTCVTPWADTASLDNTNNSFVNLTDFGKKVVLEMNRLGMMVDISHVSYNVMNAVLDVSKAPVIFSHSSAYAIMANNRNVKDDVLLKLKNNNGIVMVNFFSQFVAENATIYNVTEHIDHIVDVIGVDYVGIGSDFDGITEVPVGLEDVSKFPALFDLLQEKNPERWTNENLEKLAGRNLIRVFKAVEQVRDQLSTVIADESLIPEEDLIPFQNAISTCTSE